MTHLHRIARDILHDPWTSRIFLAFTVGLFLSCSAEFAASQDAPRLVAPATQPSPSPVAVMPESGQAR